MIKEKVDKAKVGKLKDKAKDLHTPNSGSTSESVLYGPQNDNGNASGSGEYDH